MVHNVQIFRVIYFDMIKHMYEEKGNMFCIRQTKELKESK